MGSSFLWFGLLLLSWNIALLKAQCISDRDPAVVISRIVDAIRGSHFTLVDCPSDRFESLIPDIIHTTYAKSEKNFDIIITFAKSLEKITPTFLALKTLDAEMRINGDQNPNKLIILANTIQNEVVRQSNVGSDILAEANRIVDDLVGTIRTAATKFFIDAITSNDYKTRDDVHKLANEIHIFRPKVSDGVIQGLINGTYGKVDIDTILINIDSHIITAQALTGIDALFWKLKDDGKINSPSVVLLASYLRQLQDREDFASLSKKRQGLVSKVVDNIPTCARNIYSSTGKVCLWNKARSSYLLAADASYNFNDARRNIFTYSTPLDDVPAGAVWKLHKVDDKLLFESNVYPTEYLYVAYIDYSESIHHVFSWIVGNNTEPESQFTIESEGDYCRLKSVHFQEYIYASEVKFKDQPKYSYVFSWKGGASVGPEFLWQIRSC